MGDFSRARYSIVFLNLSLYLEFITIFSILSQIISNFFSFFQNFSWGSKKATLRNFFWSSKEYFHPGRNRSVLQWPSLQHNFQLIMYHYIAFLNTNQGITPPPPRCTSPISLILWYVIVHQKIQFPVIITLSKPPLFYIIFINNLFTLFLCKINLFMLSDIIFGNRTFSSMYSL